MMSREAYEYAERQRAGLPGGLRAVREAAGLTRYKLAQRCGISREMIGRVERGEANPSWCVVAQLCHGAGWSVARFAEWLEKAAGDQSADGKSVNDD